MAMFQFCYPNLSESTTTTTFPTSLVSAFGFNYYNNRTVSVRLKSSKKGLFLHKTQIFKSIHNPQSISSGTSGNHSLDLFSSCLRTNNNNVEEKIHFLTSEFRSLSEPIERVKRLLHYATLLPPFEESARIQENRVLGCTTMVWLEVEMDNNRLMRYRVDSDSEIAKGYSSCLIWLFDGASPEEILRVKSDDLMEMNVGFTSRGHSRVKTWHNILISMQRRTQNLVSGEG